MSRTIEIKNMETDDNHARNVVVRVGGEENVIRPQEKLTVGVNDSFGMDIRFEADPVREKALQEDENKQGATQGDKQVSDKAKEQAKTPARDKVSEDERAKESMEPTRNQLEGKPANYPYTQTTKADALPAGKPENQDARTVNKK